MALVVSNVGVFSLNVCLSTGYSNFAYDIEMMLGQKPNVVFRICWLTLTPMTILVRSFTYRLNGWLVRSSLMRIRLTRIRDHGRRDHQSPHWMPFRSHYSRTLFRWFHNSPNSWCRCRLLPIYLVLSIIWFENGVQRFFFLLAGCALCTDDDSK